MVPAFAAHTHPFGIEIEPHVFTEKIRTLTEIPAGNQRTHRINAKKRNQDIRNVGESLASLLVRLRGRACVFFLFGFALALCNDFLGALGAFLVQNGLCSWEERVRVSELTWPIWRVL